MAEDFLAKVVIEGEDRSGSAALRNAAAGAETAGAALRKTASAADTAGAAFAKTGSSAGSAAAALDTFEQAGQAASVAAGNLSRGLGEAAKGADGLQAGAKKATETVSKIAGLANVAGTAFGGMGGAGGQAATALVGAFGAGGPVGIALAATAATIGIVATKWMEIQDRINSAKEQLKGAQMAGIIAGEEGEREAKAQLKAMSAKPGDEEAEKAGASLEFAVKKASDAAAATRQLAAKEAELEDAKRRLEDARLMAAGEAGKEGAAARARFSKAKDEVRRLEAEASTLAEEARTAGEASSANMKASAAFDQLARAKVKKAKAEEKARAAGGRGGGRARDDSADLASSLKAMDKAGDPLDAIGGWEKAADDRSKKELERFHEKNDRARKEAHILEAIAEKQRKDEKAAAKESARAHKEALRQREEEMRQAAQNIVATAQAAAQAIGALKSKDASGGQKIGALLGLAGTVASIIPGGQLVGAGLLGAGAIASQFHAGGQVTAHAGTYLRGGRNGTTPVSALEGEGVVDRDTMGLLGGSRALPRIREMARGGGGGASLSLSNVTFNLHGSAPAHRDQAVRLLREALPIALKGAISSEEKRLAALTGTRPSR